MPISICAGFVDAVAGGGGIISLPAYILLECQYIWHMELISSQMALEHLRLP
ncbi:putative membrane protein YfcA [Clostridium beijerinckii]|nr:putative membrane protein YfcA [Clostridium beijerinckii]